MDHECSCVEELHWTALDDLALLADANEVGRLDHGKGDSERIHPKGICLYRILHDTEYHQLDTAGKSSAGPYPDSDMSGDALVETVFAEDTKRRSQSAFHVRALFMGILEFRRGGKGHGLISGFGLTKTGLESPRADLVIVLLILGECC